MPVIILVYKLSTSIFNSLSYQVRLITYYITLLKRWRLRPISDEYLLLITQIKYDNCLTGHDIR